MKDQPQTAAKIAEVLREHLLINIMLPSRAKSLILFKEIAPFIASTAINYRSAVLSSQQSEQARAYFACQMAPEQSQPNRCTQHARQRVPRRRGH